MKFDLLYFCLALAIGMLIIYVTAPKPKIVIKKHITNEKDCYNCHNYAKK